MLEEKTREVLAQQEAEKEKMTLFADDLDASLQKMEDRLFSVIAKKVRE